MLCGFQIGTERFRIHSGCVGETGEHRIVAGIDIRKKTEIFFFESGKGFPGHVQDIICGDAELFQRSCQFGLFLDFAQFLPAGFIIFHTLNDAVPILFGFSNHLVVLFVNLVNLNVQQVYLFIDRFFSFF